MSKVLAFASAVEAATGLALVVYPPVVTRLLVGEGVSGAGMALGRVAGFGLLSLGLACWPSGNAAGGAAPAVRAMLTYNLLATLYLLCLGTSGDRVGWLLWPAVVLHAVLTLLLTHAWFRKTTCSTETKAYQTSHGSM